jgi:hypothetical protein
MKPLLVIPFHDPKWLPRTLENVRRQTLALPVLLVLNGSARGLSVADVETVTSEDSHAAAVNAGAAWASVHGFSHVILFDSDDYYGSGYAEKVVLALETADYCGQRELFAQLQDGSVHLMSRPGRSFVFATIGFAVDKFVSVSDVLDNCQDWSLRMDHQGCEKIDTGPSHYCYSRHGGNAHWDGRIPDVCVRLAWGPTRSFGQVPPTMCEKPERYFSQPCPAPTEAEIFEGLACPS